MITFRRNDNINVLKNIIEIFSILIKLIIVGIAVHSYILLLINYCTLMMQIIVTVDLFLSV